MSTKRFYPGRVATLFVAGILLFGSLFSPLQTSQTSALSGSEFNPGKIIDDGVFFVPHDMDIQGFLNSRVPNCDTNGTQQSEYGGGTRAQYGTSRGYPPPYTCLKDYRQDTTYQPAEAGICNGFGPGNKGAAQIIYEVAQSCGINPRVLIVLLQKEQSLVTDTWPFSSQYRTATGYGCPDTAACDSQYYGFFNQVYLAARQFKKYKQSPNSYNYRPGRVNYILWNPNAGACGGSDVFIENSATAALYNYTPYRPNQAALNNLYGTGDSCSSYGNRNFWRMFNDWFGIPVDNTPQAFSVRMTNNRGYHYYTNRPVEQYIARWHVGFKEESPVQGYKVQPGQAAGTVPVYHLVHHGTGDHFYTTSTQDRDIARDLVRYQEVGVSYYVYPTDAGGKIPVYSLVHDGLGDHFYTTSENERNVARDLVRYRETGVAFYVDP